MTNTRIIDTRTITADGPMIDFQATDAEKKELEKRFDVSHLNSFSVSGRFGYDDLITFDGKMTITAERVCVVTLKPFTETSEHEIHLLFVPDTEKFEDTPDQDILPIHKGKINLFDVFAEEFGLNLNPFPKSISDYGDYTDPTDLKNTNNPFAVLKKLK
ncbi:MAG: DUF177 domain-containing protein [Alphaproteobacteria bacterium]|nr:DUF177 domain-containing protein [Alphaproteobacteria bacterium]